MKHSHIDPEELSLWLMGDLDAASAAVVEEHLETCARCSAEAEDCAVTIAKVAEFGGSDALPAARKSIWNLARQAVAASIIFVAGMGMHAAISQPDSGSRVEPPSGVRPQVQRAESDLDPSLSGHSTGLARGLAALRYLASK